MGYTHAILHCYMGHILKLYLKFKCKELVLAFANLVTLLLKHLYNLS